MADTDAALTTDLHERMPFARELGVQVITVDHTGVVARAEWAAERCTSGGILHGGYLMALADTIGALCAVQHLPEGAGTATIESKTNFLRGVPAAAGEVTISATPVHTGRTTIVVQTDITNREGKLIIRTTQTQAVLKP